MKNNASSPAPISRRGILGQATLLGAGLLAAGTSGIAAGESPNAAAEAPSGRKLKIIVAGGHPGDPEYGCGGVIARFTDLGHEVVLLYLNEGDPSATTTRPASDVRVKEAAKACEILKARPIFAGQIDGHAIIDHDHYEQFGQLIGNESPDVVFTQWPIDNHRDHRATAMLAYDAWRQSKRKFSLYYYEVSNGEDTLQFAPTHYIDISDVEPRKQAACYAHASQAPGRFYRLQDEVAAFRGLENGCKKAEAFIMQIQSPVDVLAELKRGAS
jgi:LmbE family N-acetylglucosaminyl deacetylase